MILFQPLPQECSSIISRLLSFVNTFFEKNIFQSLELFSPPFRRLVYSITFFSCCQHLNVKFVEKILFRVILSKLIMHYDHIKIDFRILLFLFRKNVHNPYSSEQNNLTFYIKEESP